MNAFNPEAIVIGGSIAAHRPEILEVARAEIAARCFPVPAARVKVAPAELGDDVSLVGCLNIVNERIGDPAYVGGSHRPQMAAVSQKGA